MRALAIENVLRAKGISPTTIHLPNFAGAVADPTQPVRPTYAQAPAPMGVADIGLENRSGVLVPYELNTTSVEGTVNITNLQSLYVDGDGPDTYGIQLNSVVNGVTVFNNSSYEFWSQNYAVYTPSTQQLVFGDEVWNFSNYSTVFPANSVYAFGPNGTWALFPALYQGIGPEITIGYPFTLTLYLNTSTIGDRPALYFNYTLSNATFSQSSSFDYLIFNSTVGTPTRAAPTPYYQADGYNYDPVGLPNDMEMTILGNDDGDTTAFTAADATISLEYWNATAGEMREVPSAYDCGSDTGETAVGLLVYSSGGPSPVALVRLGPSFLGGLWNYSAVSGATAITLHLRPANAFMFINPGGAENVSEAQWVPTSVEGTSPTSVTGITVFYVPTGGTYFFDFLMSDRDPVSFNDTITAPVPLVVPLPVDATQGVYTPLFALNNYELPTISSSGTGTAADPYVLIANQHGSLAPQFAQWNDFLFPVFPGLLIANTSAWVQVTPPSFEISIPSWELTAADVTALGPSGTIASFGLPPTNNLQIQFYDASNISLVNAPDISGWLSQFLSEFPESSVMLWNCTDVLIASNTFLDQGNALLLYGGTNNTVWGNMFLNTSVAATNPLSVDDNGSFVTGINESESGDLIYNNFFQVPIPAVTPTIDPFYCFQYVQCYPVNYTDLWNVSWQPATNYTIVHGVNLTGSIIGTSYQGGNYWSNYGTSQNPYGVLPYNDSGWITVGGDYVPLVPFSLYTVTFQEVGLVPGASWNVTLNGVLAQSTIANPSTIQMESPNGTFSLVVAGPAGYVISAPSEVSVQGAPMTVSVTFTSLVKLQVRESGLPADAEWSASVNGTGTGNMTVTESNDTTTMAFEVPPGTYNVTATAAGFAPAPPFLQRAVGALGALVNFTFTALPGVLVLHVVPYNASVWVDGKSVILSGGTAYVSVPAGETAIVATSLGYYSYYNNVTVTTGLASTVNVTLNPIGVSSSSSSGVGGISTTGWVVIAALVALAVALLVGLVYLMRRLRRAPSPAAPSPPQEWQESPPGPPPST